MEVAQHYLRSGTPTILTLLDCSKAFDKCQFDILFNKLIDRGLPAIVVRALIFVYEEQVAYVSWGGTHSCLFNIKNGTWQGAVLSPVFWAAYADDLIKELRALGVGCYIANTFMGATVYADDILLLAPTRSAMAAMLSICER